MPTIPQSNQNNPISGLYSSYSLHVCTQMLPRMNRMSPYTFLPSHNSNLIAMFNQTNSYTLPSHPSYYPGITSFVLSHQNMINNSSHSICPPDFLSTSSPNPSAQSGTCTLHRIMQNSYLTTTNGIFTMDATKDLQNHSNSTHGFEHYIKDRRWEETEYQFLGKRSIENFNSSKWGSSLVGADFEQMRTDLYNINGHMKVTKSYKVKRSTPWEGWSICL